MNPFVKYQPEFDLLNSEEHFLLKKCLVSVEEFIKNSRKINHTEYATRDAHSKTYAVVEGELVMEEELPPIVREAFSKEKYPVIARLSHANPVLNTSKNEMPAFGFALKIKGDNQKFINFPLANFPLFPMKSVSKFLRFFTSLNTFLITKKDNFLVSAMDLPALVKHSSGFIFPMLSLEMMKNFAKIIASKNDFILSFDYHSIGVFRIGDFMMKIKLVPHYRHADFEKQYDQRTRVENYIQSTNADFDVMMQFCNNLILQPVNDLTKEWRKSDFIKIATLKIPQKSLRNPDAAEIENMSFNPFENPEFLQPVGKIQQLRRAVYEKSIETRNRLNYLH